MISQWKNGLKALPGGIKSFATLTKRTRKHKTVGIIIIGDEILKGEVADTNSYFTCSILHNMGIKVKKISVVGDKIEDVSNEVALFSNLFSYVITSGGIGPTHDDITFAGIAEAFKEPLVMNPVIQTICERQKHESSKQKLAKIPQSARLKFYPELQYPSIRVKNVFVFPGIPQIFQRSFPIIAKDAFECNNKFYSKTVYLNATEDQILRDLNLLVQLCPDVEFGSYPQVSAHNTKVKITIESSDEEATNEAYSKLLQILPESLIVKCS